MENFLLRPSGTGPGTSGPSALAAFFSFGRVRLLDLVLGAADVEGEHLVVLELETGYGNMLGVERILDNLCQIHRKPFKIKYFYLCPLCWIHDVVVGSLRRLPFVPEPVAFLEPTWLDPCREHHVVHPFGGEPLSQRIIGFCDFFLSERGYAKQQGRGK